MGQKDLTEKELENYPDVFTDVVNALLYRGEQILSEEELQPAPTETWYPDKDEKLHNQFHDISKYVVQSGSIKMQYTLENETRAKRRMVLRKAGYQGAVYRGQYDGRNSYPVISCVLHWGTGYWRQPRSLFQLWNLNEIPDAAMKYVDNMKLYVYDMRHLSKEIRSHFKSDMRIVVDYLAQGKNYVPTRQRIIHLEALLRMLKALSGDSRFEDILVEIKEAEKDKGGITMCELLDKYENRGIEKGMQKAFVSSIRNLMETMNLTAEQAMDALRIPENERANFRLPIN